MHYFLRVIGRRLLHLIPVLLGVTVLTFFVLNFSSGSTAGSILGSGATPAQVNALNQKLGLNDPIFERYFIWLGHMIQGNFGTSLLTGQTVLHIISQRWATTTELLILAIIMAFIFACVASLLSVRKPNGLADWVARITSMYALSVPNFVTALVAILVISVHYGWLPPSGFVPLSQGIIPNLKTMILPAFATCLGPYATYSRVLRGDMLEQYSREDYVAAVRLKGVSSWNILIKHVFKNSMFSLVTIVSAQIGVLIGASVVVENIFGLPGMGELLQTSIYQKDFPVVEGIVVLVAVVVVLANLATDILYVVLDPRLRYASNK